MSIIVVITFCMYLNEYSGRLITFSVFSGLFYEQGNIELRPIRGVFAVDYFLGGTTGDALIAK